MADPLEQSDSTQPGHAGFRTDDGRAKASYFLDPSGGDLEGQILSIIGTNAEGTDGRIVRQLPRCHPQWPFLVASSVSLVGRGKPEATDAEVAEGQQPQPIASAYGRYDEYVAEVEFLQHPWQFLPDDEIFEQTEVVYDGNGEPQFATFSNEWDRYTEIDEEYDPKIITATQGQLFFATELELGGSDDVHGKGFPGTPRFPYPETVLRVVWHAVPYRYVSSPDSFLKRYANRVNQNQWVFQGYTFEPGQLLYLGFKYKRWQAPFPLPDEEFAGRFALEKWVDVTMTFAFCDREALSRPDLPNPNWIPQHHNALPSFFDRDFHYVCSFRKDAPTDRNYWRPIYESAELRLLFMDPDVGAPNPRTP